MVRTLLVAAAAVTALTPSLALASPPAPHPETAAQAGYGRDPGPSADTRDREEWLQGQIVRDVSTGALDKREAREVMKDLDHVRRFDEIYRGSDGKLTADQARDIQARLDAVRAILLSARTTSGPVASN
jgi:hypothetical protein